MEKDFASIIPMQAGVAVLERVLQFRGFCEAMNVLIRQ